MKYKVQFSLEAKNDLNGIMKYIKFNLNEVSTAINLLNNIKEKIKAISNNPKIYSVINDEYLLKLDLRKVIVNNYLIFYRVLYDKNAVQIVRIMYGRRNWIKILNKE